MSAKRFCSLENVALRAAKFPGVMIFLLAVALAGGGCATTSAEVSKPHKPQMITSQGVEVVGGFKLPDAVDHGFKLSDQWADVVSFFGWFLQFLTGNPSG
jgi:hypothetical protein